MQKKSKRGVALGVTGLLLAVLLLVGLFGGYWFDQLKAQPPATGACYGGGICSQKNSTQECLNSVPGSLLPHRDYTIFVPGGICASGSNRVDWVHASYSFLQAGVGYQVASRRCIDTIQSDVANPPAGIGIGYYCNDPRRVGLPFIVSPRVTTSKLDGTVLCAAIASCVAPQPSPTPIIFNPTGGWDILASQSPRPVIRTPTPTTTSYPSIPL